MVSGPVLLPQQPVQTAPTGAESLVRVLRALVWPVYVLAVIASHGGMWIGFIAAIIVSSVLTHLARDMKRRRIVAAQQARVVQPPADPRGDLR